MPVFACLCLLVLYARKYAPFRESLDATCWFGGDEWEYQSIAVNLVRGHGFPVFGGVEPFEAYRFGSGEHGSRFVYGSNYGFEPVSGMTYEEWFLAAGRRGGVLNFYRTPGYPMFLALVYKTVGVAPRSAKTVQLSLLILVASFFPLLVFLYDDEGWAGFLAGAAAGWHFLAKCHVMSAFMMAESVTAFCVFLFLLAFLIWLKRTGTWTSLVLGATLGAAILVKGIAIFLAPFVVAYAVVRCSRRNTALRHAMLIVAGLAAVILPWSAFATARSGSLILLSTQGAYLLREGNNLLSAETGQWMPRGSRDQDSFYQRPDIKDRSAIGQVLLFGLSHAAVLPRMLAQKLRAGFDSFVLLRVFLALLCLEIAASFLPLRMGLAHRVIGLLGLVLATGIIGGSRQMAWLDGDICVLLAACVVLSALKAASKEGLSVALPAPMLLLMLGWMSATLTLFGEERFSQPIEFVFAFAAYQYMLRCLMRMIDAGSGAMIGPARVVCRSPMGNARDFS